VSQREPRVESPTLFDLVEADPPTPVAAGSPTPSAAGPDSDVRAASAPTAGVRAAADDAAARDLDDVALVSAAPPRLRPFNEAGVLHPADVHAAVALCGLTGCADEDVLLATALAVRGPRVGHVCVDLRTVAATVVDVEDDAGTLHDLPWPTDVAAWVAEVGDAAGLVSRVVADAAGPDTRVDAGRGEPSRSGDATLCPLVLHGTQLYLDRYWRYEQRLAGALEARARRPVAGIDRNRLREGLDRLFGAPGTEGAEGANGEPDLQRLAAATAVTRQLAVVAGGPGTGKTTTVARLLALLDEQAAGAGSPPPRVALVAPTGKAAARLEESLREALDRREFQEGVSSEVRERLAAAEAATIHRLLRRQPGNSSRFRHDASEPLPHDVVVVDEASMVSLSLMAKLLDALPASSRLVLVGDPQQLRSVEAGAVLGDIVGPALQGLRLGPETRRALAEVTGENLGALGGDHGGVAGAPQDQDRSPIGDGIVVLQRVHRFDETSGIADLAAAVQAGDADEVVRVLDDEAVTDVTWVRRAYDAGDDDASRLDGVRDAVTTVGRRISEAAASGDARTALEAVEETRVLCAHRRGPFGVATWVPRIEDWLDTPQRSRGRGAVWQVGVPVLATHNDHQLRIYNGDVGVVIATDDGPRIAFPRADGPRFVPPGRLEGLEPVHAMTIHKSQGSQFRHAIVVLPTQESRILSRELFYTGVTRARRQVTVVASEAAVRAAVGRVVQRASGLRERLWGAGR
jgi:exodeoxyribonuclease V alpha subunit